MCRLFGFRAARPDAVHPSLITERNSLRWQSREHQDGWGIASYVAGSPFPVVAHGLGPAHLDPDFERVSSLVTSHAVLAHVRLASVGGVQAANAHPFTDGRWAFAHNGTLRHYARHQAALEALIDRAQLARVKGTTDTERCFRLFLTHLARGGGSGASDVARALAAVMGDVARITDDEERSSMNFIVTDGETLVATRRHRSLFFLSRGQQDSGAWDEVIIASEQLFGEEPWQEVPEEGVVGVDASMRLHRWSLSEL